MSNSSLWDTQRRVFFKLDTQTVSSRRKLETSCASSCSAQWEKRGSPFQATNFISSSNPKQCPQNRMDSSVSVAYKGATRHIKIPKAFELEHWWGSASQPMLTFQFCSLSTDNFQVRYSKKDLSYCCFFQVFHSNSCFTYSFIQASFSYNSGPKHFPQN